MKGHKVIQIQERKDFIMEDASNEDFELVKGLYHCLPSDDGSGMLPWFEFEENMEVKVKFLNVVDQDVYEYEYNVWVDIHGEMYITQEQCDYLSNTNKIGKWTPLEERDITPQQWYNELGVHREDGIILPWEEGFVELIQINDPGDLWYDANDLRGSTDKDPFVHDLTFEEIKGAWDWPREAGEILSFESNVAGRLVEIDLLYPDRGTKDRTKCTAFKRDSDGKVFIRQGMGC